jgi:hypothetical protein
VRRLMHCSVATSHLDSVVKKSDSDRPGKAVVLLEALHGISQRGDVNHKPVRARQGEPSGFSGGIVTTGPVCVQIGVTTDHATTTTRLGFGGARCPSA